MQKSRKPLSIIGLVMINVIAIDSLRNLPPNASNGLSLVLLYGIASLLFLLPCILVTAELATHYPKTGGVYVWVREAFGKKTGFLTIWLQWIYNVFWYPTILSFMAVNIAYLFDPQLAHSRLFITIIVISLFSIATVVNCFGMRTSSLVSTISAIGGTLIPMILLIALGAYWYFDDKPLALQFDLQHWLPSFQHIPNLAFFAVVIFSLMGLEMSAVHAEEVKNPERDYPRALLYSGLIIVITLVLASLAIALVVPQQSLNIISGIDQALEIFLGTFQLQWLMPIALVLIILGGFGSMAAWVIGPTKGLVVAAEDGSMPKSLMARNKKGVPINILILQAVVVLLLSSLLLFFKHVSTYYWLLSDLTAQLALMFYIFLFAAAIRLRYLTPYKEGAFRIPGGKIGIWLVGIIGILTCIGGIAIGFIPPQDVTITHPDAFELTLFFGIIIFTIVPILIHQLCRKKIYKQNCKTL